MSSEPYIMKIVAEFTDAFNPLALALENTETFDDFLGEFGWELGAAGTIEDISSLLGNVNNILPKLRPLADTIKQALEKHEAPDSKVFDELVTSIKGVAKAIRGITTISNSTLAPFNNAAFRTSFPSELAQYLTSVYLEHRQRLVFGVLSLLGVMYDEDDYSKRPRPCTLRRVDFKRLVEVVSNPGEAIATYFGWGAEQFARETAAQLLAALSHVTEAFTDAVGLMPPREADLAPYYAADNPHRRRVPALRISLVQTLQVIPDTIVGDTIVSGGLDLVILPVPPADGKDQPARGLGMHFASRGNLDLAQLPIAEGVTVMLKGGFEQMGGLCVALYPKRVHVTTNRDGVLEMQARLDAQPPVPWLLLGNDEGTRLEIRQSHLSLVARGDKANPEVIVEVGIDGGALVIDMGKGDGFLQSIFSSTPKCIDAGSYIRWSNRRGISIGGNPSLEIDIPLQQSIANIIRIQSLLLRLNASSSTRSIGLTAAISGTTKIGFLSASVERVGFVASLNFPKDREGNLGLADLEFAFKPPDGAGITVDASVVVGGGYLKFDRTNEQYTGVLQLEVKKKIALKAIGLITTRLPGGKKGFSLLLIISAEFPPIQLGYGFTLNGVGGLAGVNRTMVLDALRAGIKQHTLDSVLFPENPVEHAQRIISDLSTVFPPADGRYVFGPMAKIGWGASILTLDLGIVLELPKPVRLAIMGQLKLVLPDAKDEKKALVLLKMDVLGAIDFDRGDASIDASLYDSHVAAFTISGDMAMRLNWGDHPTFVLAAGGLNPRFPPPPDFPTLERLAISLSSSDRLRVRLESYFALTANSVQFGARLDLYAAARFFGSTFSIAAYLGFDALVKWPPFWFQVDIDAGVSLCRNGRPLFGIDLHAALSGPEPWHAWGHATFHFLGKHHIPFDWQSEGQPPALPPPADDPLLKLCEALKDHRNWSAQFPADGHQLVTVRSLELVDEVLVHPFGALTMRQRIVPLTIAFTHFGSLPLARSHRIVVTGIKFKDQDVKKDARQRLEVRDAFAPGQFFALDDDQKLSRPSFEALPSGYTSIQVVEGAFDCGGAVTTPFGYETAIVDDPKRMPPSSDGQASYHTPEQVLVATAARGAAGKSALRRTGEAKFAHRSGRKLVTVAESSYPDPAATAQSTNGVQTVSHPGLLYAVASVDDMTVPSDAYRAPTYTEAEAIRRALPDPRRWQVVERHEAPVNGKPSEKSPTA